MSVGPVVFPQALECVHDGIQPTILTEKAGSRYESIEG